MSRSIAFLRILTYSSALVSDTRKLPNRSGIYYAVKDSEVLYVGKAISLQRRWSGNSHEQKMPLLRLGGVVLFYRFVAEHRLLLEEAKEIELFNPPLNKQRPKPQNHDRGLVRVESIAREAFWTFVWGVAFVSIPMGLAISAKHKPAQLNAPVNIDKSFQQPIKF